MKNVTIDQFLTPAEIKRAQELYATLKMRKLTTGFASQFAEEVIKPNIERINKALGQENDPRYLAYAVEYVMSRFEL